MPEMLVSAFDAFVRDSDKTAGRPDEERIRINIYGLTAEIGSVVSAIKKRLLEDGSTETWDEANEEIIEELGDIMWYCFALARIVNAKKPVNIFAHDIANLRREIGATDERALQIKRVLNASSRTAFLNAAESFPKRTKEMIFEDYQSVAILTARTSDRILVEVCLAVLWQLGGELFRRLLPRVELELNRTLPDRPINDVLGEIAWHISALASTYGLQLSTIAKKNVEKVSFRLDRSKPTPLHDADCHPSEQFPRYFEVAFVTVGPGRSRMYLNGRQLGDELTDNAYDDDGYRYHDVMHLANVAKLSWSPVLRGLMGLKRKRDSKIDEVEDGARAKIVEEAVIKAIHSEGERLATHWRPPLADSPKRLFPSSSDITFRFLKFIRNFVVDLEVHKNRYWEWEEAILKGHEIFHQLRCERQGTVTINLEKRSIAFSPDVFIDLVGRVAGLGSALVHEGSVEQYPDYFDRLTVLVQKLAIIDSLKLSPTHNNLSALDVREANGKGISIKARESVQQAIWSHQIITFKTTITAQVNGSYHCTAIGLTDDR